MSARTMMALFVFGLASGLSVPFFGADVWAQEYSFESRDTVVITGKADFEKRTTYVTMMMCDSTRTYCPKPEPYWTLVIRSGGVTYEVDQAFAVGEFKEPDAVEVAGTPIKKGVLLTVQGRLETLIGDYAVLSEVNSVVIKSDPSNPSEKAPITTFETELDPVL